MAIKREFDIDICKENLCGVVTYTHCCSMGKCAKGVQ